MPQLMLTNIAHQAAMTKVSQARDDDSEIMQFRLTIAMNFRFIMLHEHKLFSWSQKSVKSFVSEYRAYCVSNDNTLMWLCQVQTVYD